MTDNAVSQAEFARLQNVTRKTVTDWKQGGRLVLTDDGRVLVDESLQRIAATSGNRSDVSDRHRKAREQKIAAAAKPDTGGEADERYGAGKMANKASAAVSKASLKEMAARRECENSIPAQAAFDGLTAAVEHNILPLLLEASGLFPDGRDNDVNSVAAINDELTGYFQQLIDTIHAVGHGELMQ